MKTMTRLLMTASLAVLAMSGAARADEADEIVVTVTRTPVAAEALPADVAVIDVERARERGALTLDAALADVPGFDVVRSGPLGQQTSIFSGGANSQHTLVLFDGVRINDPSSPAAGFDAGQDLLAGLDRIEVVQGPMSAIYGSDAIGGVVNLIPRRGRDGAINATLDVAAGSFETLNAQAAIDGAIGRLRYALSAEGVGTEGYDIVPERMATFVDHPDGASMIAVTGLFDLALSDALSVDLLLRRREAQADFDAFFFDLSTFQEFRTDDPDLEISRNDMSLARIGATWQVSEALSLRVSGGEVETDRAQADGGVEGDTFLGERRFADATLTWESETLDVVAGATAETEEISAVQFGSPLDAEQEHWGAFAGAVVRLGVLDVTGAVRIDDYDGFGQETTWRIGANWRVWEGARLYAAYGASFRAPTLYERFVSFGNPLLDPEEGESWEIGADAEFSAFGQSDGLELGLLYRASDLTNMIDFGPFFTYVNIDEAELRSAEARAAIRPTDWLTLRGGYVWTQAEDTTTGLALLRRPEQSWRFAVDADWGDVRASLYWRSAGERRDVLYGDSGVFLGQGETEGYELLSASASWDVRESVTLYASAENLLDEDYEPANAFAGQPRSVLVGVRLKAGAD